MRPVYGRRAPRPRYDPALSRQRVLGGEIGQAGLPVPYRYRSPAGDLSPAPSSPDVMTSIESPVPSHALVADPFYRLGRWAHCRRWLVIGLWVLAVVVALPAAPGASRALSP